MYTCIYGTRRVHVRSGELVELLILVTACSPYRPMTNREKCEGPDECPAQVAKSLYIYIHVALYLDPNGNCYQDSQVIVIRVARSCFIRVARLLLSG